MFALMYGVVWRRDKSPLQTIAQRCALVADLRGEAPGRLPKPRVFIIHCSFLAMGVGFNR